MAQITLYVPDEDIGMVNQAMQLLRSHEKSSLSERTVTRCKEIVKKYDNKTDVEDE